MNDAVKSPLSQESSDNANNLTRFDSAVSLENRTALLQQYPRTIWLTGLSGAGKSTLASWVEQKLVAQNRLAFILDGDNVRHGLNRDLGFSPQDRHENIRRVAEVARLFNQAGLIVLVSFISPYIRDRLLAKTIIGADNFLEVHLSTDLRTCEQRDIKGLYKKARRGEIADFTGISAPYEVPEAPDLRIDTETMSIEQSGQSILNLLASHTRYPPALAEN